MGGGVCSVLTLIITIVNSVAKFMDFSGKQERHALSMKEFGGLQRDLLTYLVATDQGTVLEDIDGLEAKYQAAKDNMPLLMVPLLVGHKLSDGTEEYTHITEPEEM